MAITRKALAMQFMRRVGTVDELARLHGVTAGYVEDAIRWFYYCSRKKY